MLSEKPWNFEALLRLMLGAFICLCLGSVVASSLHYAGRSGTGRIFFFAIAALAIILLTIAVILVAQRWTIEHSFRRLLLMLGCISGGLSLAAVAQGLAGRLPESASGEQMVIADAGVFALFFGFLRAQGINWSDAFGLANRRLHAVLSGIAVACIFLPVGEGLQRGSAELMSRLRIEPQEQQAVHAVRVASTWSDRAVLAMLALVLAPVVEEMLFRGMLYPAIKQAGFPRLALWGVSLGFAFIHSNVMTFIPLMVLALLLTILYERTNNLLAPIAAHALFNGLNFVRLYLFEHSLAK